MRLTIRSLIAAAAISIGTPAVHAQTAAPADAAVVAEGRRVFHQKCALCHVANTLGEEPYGPKLSRTQVDKSEEGVRQIIRDGLVRMPGFQYTLDARQIDAIVAFLKTLDAPPARILVKTPLR